MVNSEKINKPHPFGELMQKARNSIKPRKMSLQSLASMIQGANGSSVSKSFLSNVEIGRSPPHKSYPATMAVIFPNISLEEWYYAFFMSINSMDVEIMNEMPDHIREDLAAKMAKHLVENNSSF